MLVLKWKHGTTELKVGDERTLDCSCRVRNFENGKRRKWEVVHTMPNGKPYQPVEFPVGRWEVGRPIARNQVDLAPFFIPTDACAEVQVWSVTNGCYEKALEEWDTDRSYGIHHSSYSTTLGCVKIESRDELLWLVDRVQKELGSGEKVFFEVEENDAAQEG